LNSEHDVLGREIRLHWLGISRLFHSFDLPIQIGRMRDTDFVVNDPRVSRIHARLEWRNGSIMFVDTSSYGSWVRFADTAPILLRREECILHGTGELALGASFTDENCSVITFVVY
jgi:adenylate cyclase